MRYRLLETLRQYGEERLEVDTSRFRDRHLRHYLAVAEQAHRLWMSPRQREGDAAFDCEWDNLRVPGHGPCRQGTSTPPTPSSCGRDRTPTSGIATSTEIRATRTLSLETTDRVPTRPRMLGEAAFWAFVAGDLDRAVALAKRGIEVGRGPQDVDTTWCWVWLALLVCRPADQADAEEASRCALVAAGDFDPFIEGGALGVHIDVMGGSDPAATTRAVDRHAEAVEIESEHRPRARDVREHPSPKPAGFPRLVSSPSALRIFQRGLILARGSGAVLPEALNLQGVAQVGDGCSTFPKLQMCVESTDREVL